MIAIDRRGKLMRVRASLRDISSLTGTSPGELSSRRDKAFSAEKTERKMLIEFPENVFGAAE